MFSRQGPALVFRNLKMKFTPHLMILYFCPNFKLNNAIDAMAHAAELATLFFGKNAFHAWTE